MGVDEGGKAHVKHRTRIRTPQMRGPTLLGLVSQRLYRGGSAKAPYLLTIRIGAAPRTGVERREAAGGRTGRRRRFAADPRWMGFVAEGAATSTHLRQICTPRCRASPRRGGAQLGGMLGSAVYKRVTLNPHISLQAK